MTAHFLMWFVFFFFFCTIFVVKFLSTFFFSDTKCKAAVMLLTYPVLSIYSVLRFLAACILLLSIEATGINREEC